MQIFQNKCYDLYTSIYLADDDGCCRAITILQRLFTIQQQFKNMVYVVWYW